MRCPVLRWAMLICLRYAMPGTEVDYADTRRRYRCGQKRLSPRFCYAMSGTDIGYAAIRDRGSVCYGGISPVGSPKFLRTCSAMSGTDIASAAICLRARVVPTKCILLSAYARAVRCPPTRTSLVLVPGYLLAILVLIFGYVVPPSNPGTDLWVCLFQVFLENGVVTPASMGAVVEGAEKGKAGGEGDEKDFEYDVLRQKEFKTQLQVPSSSQSTSLLLSHVCTARSLVLTPKGFRAR
eukprot:2096295-Rhodomonas_salina.3